MLDLQQISLLLKFSTRKSLVIIDEFGKGTDLNGEFCLLLRRLWKLNICFYIRWGWFSMWYLRVSFRPWWRKAQSSCCDSLPWDLWKWIFARETISSIRSHGSQSWWRICKRQRAGHLSLQVGRINCFTKNMFKLTDTSFKSGRSNLSFGTMYVTSIARVVNQT